MAVPSRRAGRKIVSFLPGKKKDIFILVYDGGSLLLGPDAASEMPLYPGRVLSYMELERLKELAKEESIREKALVHLKKKNRSRHELVRLLIERNGADFKTASKVVERLEKDGLVDDRAFVSEKIEEVSFRLYGPWKLQEEIKEARIEPLLYEKAVYQDEEGVACKALAAFQRTSRHLPLLKKKEKARTFLMRRGFSSLAIEKAVASLEEDREAVLLALHREALLLRETLARKYNVPELERHLSSTLLRHGYSRDDIRRELEENDATHQRH